MCPWGKTRCSTWNCVATWHSCTIDAIIIQGSFRGHFHCPRLFSVSKHNVIFRIATANLDFPGTSPKIMSLRHPEKKMSKSDRSEQSIIWLTDDKDAIHRKIKRAVTDSTPDTMTYELWRVLSAEGDQTNTRLLQDRHRAFFALSANEQRARAGVQNLWSMSAACMDASLADTYAEFCRQYDDDRLLAVSSLKEFTARNILATLAPIHARFNDLKEDDQAVKQVLKHGAEMAGRIAAETMQQVRRDVGLLRI